MPRLRFALALAVTAGLLIPAAAPAAGSKNRDVTVMSRNLYLGADIIRAATAKTPDELKADATTLFGIVQQTNFPVRAKAIAREIKATHPDLVGLQEAALWRRTPDGVTDDVTNANVVVYDYLGLLQGELAALGLHYKVAVVQPEADFEVPTSLGYDLRLTMRDAILVRTGKGAKVKVVKTLEGHYRDVLSVPVPGQTINSLRGWVAVDAKAGGKAFRFVDTHLEAYGGDIRAKQAAQLLKGPAASKKRQTIVVGDLNSDIRDAAPDSLAINAFLKAGYVDAFTKPPATSGQNETVNNPVSTLKSYIDHILSRPKLKTVSTKVVGNRPADMISGLWPSDHAGTVATLRLPK